MITVTNGIVNIAADGTITVTPDNGFTGTIDVPYTIEDSDGATDSAVHSVEVPNPPPVAVDETVSTPFETPIDVDPLANDSDPDGDPLTITEINGVVLTPGTPQSITVPNGTVDVAADGTITVTPDNGFTGTIDVPYTIEDADGDTDSAVHSVTIGNAPPVAVDETVSTPFETPIDVGPLANDSDPDGDPLTITEINGVALTPGTPQSIAVPNGTVDVAADGTITVTPDNGFTGTIDVPYTIEDSDGATDSAVHSVEVPNPPPVAVDETVSTPFETPIDVDPLANDSDPDGDPLTITEINGVALTGGAQTITVTNGMVNIAAAGTITVTPDMGFTGTIDIPYTIEDADGDTAMAIHSVIVENDPSTMPLGLISGTVFQDDNNDGIQQLGEGGIAGVIVTLTGTDVFGNAVNIQTASDGSGQYAFEDLNAGEYTVTQTQPVGFIDGIDIGADGAATPINDVLTNISLGFGQTIENITFAEQLPASGDDGASGNPPILPGLPPITNTLIGNSAGSFVSAPGSIYSGVPINSNVDSLSLDSGRPITGGFSYSNDGPGLSRPLIWSLADNPQLTSPSGNSTYRVWLDGPIITGQTATVQIVRDSDFENIDAQAIRQAISDAVASYDGPGLLSFDGTTLTYQSTDGLLMSPLNIEMPVNGDSPDEMLDLYNSGNSEITPEDLPADQSASNEPETEQDSDQSASKASEPGHDSSVRIDSEVSFLKRFTNWLSPSRHIEL